jgi:hypothetical protein
VSTSVPELVWFFDERHRTEDITLPGGQVIRYEIEPPLNRPRVMCCELHTGNGDAYEERCPVPSQVRMTNSKRAKAAAASDFAKRWAAALQVS